MELLQHEVEPGWLYLFTDVSLLGLSGICDRALGQWICSWTCFHASFRSYAYSASGADDCAGSGCTGLLYPVKRKRKYLAQWEAANEQLDKVSFRLRKTITGIIDRRINKAYPKAVRTTHAEAAGEMAGAKVFAAGCGFYKVVMLFFVGAFLGDITETIFCRITAGVWMSRSSVVWGPFSIVWGLAIALGTAMLYRYKDRSDGFLFGVGTLLGGGYEYLCSVFTEMVFGKVFWDYSKLPFNLGGRINLLYCFFWGIAAVVWFKKIYPFAARWIEKIPMKAGRLLTWVLIVFMCCNVAVSCVALVRYDERSKGIAAESSWQQWADEHYDDAKMAKIYPNAKVAK